MVEMKRVALWLVGLSLLAGLLAGCGTETEARQGQEAADATVGGQAAANLTPSPEVIDPSEADAQSQAAGETPSILGSTPEAGQAGAWERQTFFEVWDIGYPDGWAVEEAGDRVVLTGAYGSQEYRVDLTQGGEAADDNAQTWAEADLAAAGQENAPLTKVSVTEVEAYKASNLTLQGEGTASCPAARVYGQEGAATGALYRIIITVAQTSGEQCDVPNTERLADAMIAEARLK
jgi:hypothetical protein